MGALLVGREASGERLDRFLAERLATPRNQVQQWIKEGRVTVAGQAARGSTRVHDGDEVVWSPPPPASSELEPEEGELHLLHVDPQMVLVDKPPGMVVHPGAGRSSGTLAHRLLARFPEIDGVGGAGRPGIVHRLDRDTSGILVVARTPDSYQQLSRAFASRRVSKRYLAVVHGALRQDRLEIETPIGRHPVRRKEMAVRTGGRPAHTGVHVLARAPGTSLLEIDLATGRTHQIRVHLKSVGHPLVGDPIYGEARWKAAPAAVRSALKAFPRPALHAWKLGFSHTASGEPMTFEALPPEDLRELWRALSGRPLEELLVR